MFQQYLAYDFYHKINPHKSFSPIQTGYYFDIYLFRWKNFGLMSVFILSSLKVQSKLIKLLKHPGISYLFFLRLRCFKFFIKGPNTALLSTPDRPPLLIATKKLSYNLGLGTDLWRRSFKRIVQSADHEQETVQKKSVPDNCLQRLTLQVTMETNSPTILFGQNCSKCSKQ